MDWWKIERKWQDAWEQAKVFEADPDKTRKKCFVTFPFSYVNGPLHVGHGFTATRVDAYARFKRMQGWNVLFPWAWHWTGQPIVAASERLRRGDPAMIKEFREIDKVPEEEIQKFIDPAYMAAYYTAQNREAVKRIGFSIDWRREFHTTSLEPTFSRFVEWQYTKLREGGFVVKGTYPVVWCPTDRSPTGDHDRLEGEGVAPEEYTLMKFVLNNRFLPAATFRPETIYGVTNLWINPDAIYVEAKVNGEEWIVSREAAIKLSEQLRKVVARREFAGKELIGKNCVDPLGKRTIPILPGWFVDPKNGTGVVYSVPAHAPFDWVALRDLVQRPELIQQFGLKLEDVKSIKPISMIRLEGFGDYPAIEVVDQLKVKDQHDPRCNEATEIVYRKEFHTGVLKDVCEGYAGLTVREVKDRIIADFKAKGIADSMFDLPRVVVCRCTTRCIVKMLEGQWFLRYSDEAWKKKTRSLLDQARIYPESARQWFIDIINWLREWPCARKTGLGTPLPWSPEWIVETLSDSTVYMAFYTINKQIKQYKIKPEQLTIEVFDYIFKGNGEVSSIAKKAGISKRILEEMRNEFLYWYPVDLRISAKELLPNHLTFFLFQHSALFPPEHWPRAVAVNGMMMLEGQKMSKSKGNIVMLRSAIADYGADVVRCALLLGAEEMDDPNWKAETLRDVGSKLESLYQLGSGIELEAGLNSWGRLEDWLISMLQRRIAKVTESLENLKTRTALENALYEIWNDYRWYRRRAERPSHEAIKQLLSVWVRLLAPFAPHLSEELWHQIGEKQFVSISPWPEVNEKKINLAAEQSEELIKQTLSDVSEILNVTRLTPGNIILYTASDWKWEAYLDSLAKIERGELEPRNAIKELASRQEFRSRGKSALQFAQRLTKELVSLSPEDRRKRLEVGKLDEFKILFEAKPFFEKEFKIRFQVFHESDENIYDPKNRAMLAEPYRPAIYIE
jgi:leucyl-tRNA synthetase